MIGKEQKNYRVLLQDSLKHNVGRPGVGAARSPLPLQLRRVTDILLRHLRWRKIVLNRPSVRWIAVDHERGGRSLPCRRQDGQCLGARARRSRHILLEVHDIDQNSLQHRLPFALPPSHDVLWLATRLHGGHPHRRSRASIRGGGGGLCNRRQHIGR